MAMGEAQAALDLTLDYVTHAQGVRRARCSRSRAIRQRLAMLAAKVEAGPPARLSRGLGLDAQGVDVHRARSRW